MTNIDFQSQVDELSAAIGGRLSTSGVGASKLIYDASLPLLQWLDHIRTSELTGNADELIDGLRSSVVEALGCVTAGFLRPAIYAMRCQIDIALAWLYFKDHPVEWHNVTQTGDGFMLKRDVITYLEKFYPRFSKRFSTLNSGRTRSVEDPYRLLSAYVHSQTPATLPPFAGLKTLVWSDVKCNQASQLQSDVAEYISDVFVAVFADKWASMPAGMVAKVTARIPADTKVVFGS